MSWTLTHSDHENMTIVNEDEEGNITSFIISRDGQIGTFGISKKDTNQALAGFFRIEPNRSISVNRVRMVANTDQDFQTVAMGAEVDEIAAAWLVDRNPARITTKLIDGRKP